MCTEGYLCQIVDFGRTEAEAEKLIEEKVMQFLGTLQILGLLFDVAMFVGR